MKHNSMKVNGIEEEVNLIKIKKYKKNIFYVTTNVSEILKIKGDTIIIPSANWYDYNMHTVDEISSNDIVLKFFASVAPRTPSYNMDFDATFLKNIRKRKENIIKARLDHYGSTGYYFSFGNKGSYERVGNSSVRQYKENTM